MQPDNPLANLSPLADCRFVSLSSNPTSNVDRHRPDAATYDIAYFLPVRVKAVGR
jgi:hypothetical protein